MRQIPLFMFHHLIHTPHPLVPLFSLMERLILNIVCVWCGCIFYIVCISRKSLSSMLIFSYNPPSQESSRTSPSLTDKTINPSLNERSNKPWQWGMGMNISQHTCVYGVSMEIDRRTKPNSRLSAPIGSYQEILNAGKREEQKCIWRLQVDLQVTESTQGSRNSGHLQTSMSKRIESHSRTAFLFLFFYTGT